MSLNFDKMQSRKVAGARHTLHEHLPVQSREQRENVNQQKKILRGSDTMLNQLKTDVHEIDEEKANGCIWLLS